MSKGGVVFFGTGVFAVPALQEAAASISLVVTQPDSPAGRGMRLQPSPVKLSAVELGLQVETPESARTSEFIERVAGLQPRILLVAAYGQILPVRLLETATQGGINLHGSILPRYRGAAPIQRSIMNGDKETGVTLMRMAKGMDTGDIIDIEKTPIGFDETYGELQDRLSNIGAALTKKWLRNLMSGDFHAEPQNGELATIAPKMTRGDGELRFDGNAAEAYARFRAVTPNPGAFFFSSFGRIKLGKARLSAESGVPGTVLAGNLVAFNGGSIELLEVQPEGKKRMSGRDFFNGARLRPGDRLITYAT